MHIVAWILQSLLWVPGQVALRFRFGYRVVGLENLKKIVSRRNGVLFVVNHRTQLDPVFVAAILPFFSLLRPMHFMSLPPAEYAHLPFGRHIYGGFLFKIFGAYPAYRGLKDYEVALRHHIRLLKEGKSVCIFPEGGITKHPEGKPQKARPGVAYLAKRTGAVIVPVALTGIKKIEVRIGEPFVSSGEDEHRIMDHVVTLGGYGA